MPADAKSCVLVSGLGCDARALKLIFELNSKFSFLNLAGLHAGYDARAWVQLDQVGPIYAVGQAEQVW